jgi:glycosyltransferase involved in cell wall biosynthesis
LPLANGHQKRCHGLTIDGAAAQPKVLSEVMKDDNSPCSTAPRIAVCIATYNQAPFILKTIASIANQTYENIEVWVSNDASTDSTASLLEGVDRSRFRQFTVIHQPRNLGLAANVDFVLRQPNAEYIFRIDSDDLAEPKCLQELMSLLLKYPNAGYAHSATFQIDHLGSIQRIRRLNRNSEYRFSEDALRASVKCYRVAANICLFRAAALRSAGYINPQLRYGEDWDLSIRIAAAGYGNAYCGIPLSSYRSWVDHAGARSRRRISELQGIEHIYSSTLEKCCSKFPAIRKQITRNRRYAAIQSALSVRQAVLDGIDETALFRAIMAIHDSVFTRAAFKLGRNRASASVIETANRCILAAKDRIKELLPVPSNMARRLIARCRDV